MITKLLAIALTGTISAAGLVGCTASEGEYETVSIPQGGSRTGTAVVRTDDQQQADREAPYALTGERREPQQTTHPKGTHTSP